MSSFLSLMHGAHADPEIIRREAPRFGALIVRESSNGNVHVKLSDGSYGFFAPGGSPKTYIWFKSCASNYEENES